jgi:predicted metal-dependent TIM-barrel fold hydrolase
MTDMKFIDPHIHMISRTTDDYVAMAKAGIVAVIEPAFWIGQPRTTVGSFQDYFSMLVGWERFRANQFGIQHYCTMGLNSKEANNEALAEAVIELLPRFVNKERVVAIGEIGYDDQTPLEEKYFRIQLVMAKELNIPVMIHTPHRNKVVGTSRSMDLCEDVGLDPSMVVVDHNNEGTVKEVLERGYWAGFTLYPNSKMNSERMAEVVKTYGTDRIFVNSSADWGESDPLSVPKTAKVMLDRGVTPEQVKEVCYNNAIAVYSQSGQFNEEDWTQTNEVDQGALFEGNSVKRSGE